MAMQVSPETIQQVADLLSNCSSSNNETRGLYLETLSRAEKTPGFLSILLVCFGLRAHSFQFLGNICEFVCSARNEIIGCYTV